MSLDASRLGGYFCHTVICLPVYSTFSSMSFVSVGNVHFRSQVPRSVLFSVRCLSPVSSPVSYNCHFGFNVRYNSSVVCVWSPDLSHGCHDSLASSMSVGRLFDNFHHVPYLEHSPYLLETHSPYMDTLLRLSHSVILSARTHCLGSLVLSNHRSV